MQAYIYSTNFRGGRIPRRRPLPDDPAGGHVPQAPRFHGRGGVPHQGGHLEVLWAATVGHVPHPLRHARVRAHPEGQGRDGKGAGAAGEGQVSKGCENGT